MILWTFHVWYFIVTKPLGTWPCWFFRCKDGTVEGQRLEGSCVSMELEKNRAQVWLQMFWFWGLGSKGLFHFSNNFYLWHRHCTETKHGYVFPRWPVRIPHQQEALDSMWTLPRRMQKFLWEIRDPILNLPKQQKMLPQISYVNFQFLTLWRSPACPPQMLQATLKFESSIIPSCSNFSYDLEGSLIKTHSFSCVSFSVHGRHWSGQSLTLNKRLL